MQSVRRGITRMPKNAAQTDPGRKWCPTAALRSFSHTFYITSLFLFLSEPSHCPPSHRACCMDMCVSVLAAVKREDKEEHRCSEDMSFKLCTVSTAVVNTTRLCLHSNSSVSACLRSQMTEDPGKFFRHSHTVYPESSSNTRLMRHT